MIGVPATPARLLRHPHGWLALGLGAGLSPVAPGTAGSAVAVVLWLAFVQPPVPGLPARIAVVVLAALLCTWSAHWAAQRLQRKDPGCIVSDELAGQWLALLAAPDTWPGWLAAFGLFRLFDIAKPWPVRRLERLPGGIGIVADDLAAGAWAALVQLAALALLPA